MTKNVKDFFGEKVTFPFDVIIGQFVILEMGCIVRKHKVQFFCGDRDLSLFPNFKIQSGKVQTEAFSVNYALLKKKKLVALTREH
jgi:hypothetical protein